MYACLRVFSIVVRIRQVPMVEDKEMKQEKKYVYVVKHLMANKDKPEYHRFDTRFFVSEKKALAYQKQGTGYRGSSRPKFNHASVDIEVYELKKIIKGKRAKRFYSTQHWYMQPNANGKVDIVITEKGKQAGIGGTQK